jgi:catechol 2,3-dioxygenase-like lactoylglutathione lyase family enzyme
MNAVYPKPRLVPELLCRDLKASLAFYTQVTGFCIVYERPEFGFAYLEREGAELMLEASPGDGEDHSRAWIAGPLERPFGRGINFQIQVSDVEMLYANVKVANAPLFMDMESKWYRKTDYEVGNRQFIVSDPDGYLLRFYQDLGRRDVI